MATCPISDYEICWLQPDNTFCYSAFKAHWDSEPWHNYGHYMIPAVMEGW